MTMAAAIPINPMTNTGAAVCDAGDDVYAKAFSAVLLPTSMCTFGSKEVEVHVSQPLCPAAMGLVLPDEGSGEVTT